MNGKITYNEFHINFDIPLEDEIDNLTEDLLQIEYDGGYILDVGWYPEFDIEGKLIVRVIKNCEWDKPLFVKCCKSKAELKSIIKNAVELIVRYK